MLTFNVHQFDLLPPTRRVHREPTVLSALPTRIHKDPALTTGIEAPLIFAVLRELRGLEHTAHKCSF